MKRIALILFGLISISLSSFAQKNLYPINFEITDDVSKIIVRRDCLICKPEEKNALIQVFHFDENGFNYEKSGIDDGQKSGMQKYFWNTDGSIKSYQNFNSFRGSGSGDDFGQIWLDTILTNELKYEYQNSLLAKITWIDGLKMKTTLEVHFEYDTDGRVIKEQIIDYPDRETSIGFKPNSIEIIGLPDANNKVINYKEFTYKSDTTYITYFAKGIKSGAGKKVVNEKKQLQFGITYDLTGNVIYEIENEYNEQGNVVTQVIRDTGYDGFGNAYDFAGRSLVKFDYNTDNRLITKSTYFEGEIWTVENYEYVK